MPYVKIKNTVTHNIKCAKCGEQFDLTEEERQFCLEGKLPIPTLCLSCRLAVDDNGGKSGDGAGARQRRQPSARLPASEPGRAGAPGKSRGRATR